ncbi:signal peptidase I [Romboutsia weinsteinii]|uniref:Signal peptidase I n=1 Tax=Romboutsia weinsteinii TaxID=2020949 RepID=A0A371J3S0_9FIRM|nr:signal peptidase I [Romboutsia weinsteinii]RDY27419.1 signal peptidase I [Romboutsia weinsteinii]
MDIKKVLNIAWDIIFYTFLIGSIVLTISISKTHNPGEGPSVFGYKFYTVLTESMSPTMNKGSLLIVKESKKQDIKVDDAITFFNEARTSVTTHRVKEVSNIDGKIKFTTQGDANNTVDPEQVDGDLLVGKVVFHVPFIGAMLEVIRENIKLVLGGLFLIIIITSIPNKHRKDKRKASSIN